MTALDRMRASRVLPFSTLVLFVGTLLPHIALAGTAGQPADVPGPSALAIPETGSEAAANTLADASVEPSTGSARSQIALRLPHARGAAQPQIGLSYTSTRGIGLAGWGWTLGAPSIERHAISGRPGYDDPASANARDRVYFNGHALVALCKIPDAYCYIDGFPTYQPPGGNPEYLPTSIGAGWSYFRQEEEGSFARFFLSPDRKTWLIQDKSGVVMELGLPLDGSGNTSAIDTDPQAGGSAFRWNIARAYDSHKLTSGAPANVVLYRWKRLPSRAGGLGGQGYLVDVYDTPPPAGASDTSLFAHHVHLTYELPSKSFAIDAAPIGHSPPQQRLAGVDVTSRGSKSGREQVRRYRMAYSERAQRSYLTSVSLEGRCDPSSNPVELGDGTLDNNHTCITWPKTTLTYSPGTPGTDPGAQPVTMTGTTPGGDQSTPYDVNADGVPDFLGPGTTTQAVAFSGAQALNTFTAGTVYAPSGSLTPLPWVAPQGNVVPPAPAMIRGNFLDDGKLNLLENGHVFTMTHRTDGAWQWVDRPFPAAKAYFPFGVGDLDGDGLTDVIVSESRPGGGFLPPVAYFTGRDAAGATYPLGASEDVCGGGDPTGKILVGDQPGVVHLVVDMNGDGLQDIVWVRKDSITVFPSHGDGTFGACTNGTSFCDCSASSGLTATLTPAIADADLSSQFVTAHDVTGDGVPELVVATSSAVNVYSGTIGTPSPGFSNIPYTNTRLGFDGADLKTLGVLFADMDASGTDDLVVRDKAGHVTYVPFATGEPPGLLEEIHNGLGGNVYIAYKSTTSLSLPSDWSMPQPLHVVTSIKRSQSNPFIEDVTATYVYDYPVFDARARTFVGFKYVTTTRVGDANEPNSVTHATFAFAPCEEKALWLTLAPCPLGVDRPEIVQRGLPVLIEESDGASAVYRFTTHTQFNVTELYTGLDGRVVRYPWPGRRDTFLYDTAPFTGATSKQHLTDIFWGSSARDVASDMGAAPLRQEQRSASSIT